MKASARPTASTSPPSSDMISLGLSRITRLLQALRSPQYITPVVHIAGTNGKGSVSAYLASVLHAANLRVGRFNSPHLVDEWDCIRLKEEVVEESVFRKMKTEVEEVNRREGLQATPFEVLTATAFSLFARAKLDVAVVEVGMGGEGDATNVVPASKTLLSVLTAVDLDHQGFLGNTVEAIARVKSGIVRQGGDLVLSRQAYPEVLNVAKSVAESRNATVWQAGQGHYTQTSTTNCSASPQQASIPLEPLCTFPESNSSILPSSSSVDPATINASLPLPGSYQLDNSATATLAVQLLRNLPRATQMAPQLASITNAAIREGIERTRWDGRLQWLDYSRQREKSREKFNSSRQRILLDGAHNPSSASLLASYLSSIPPSQQPTTLVIGLSAPRAPSDVLTPLLKLSTGIKKVVCVEFSPPAGMPWVRPTSSDDLYRSVMELGITDITVSKYVNVEEAFAKGIETGEETIIVAGSLYLVADALRMVRRT
ncbi:hypothetical protein JCM3765_002877 [Sporobolomyces pararoseus]